jgi:hypothetical protein
MAWPERLSPDSQLAALELALSGKRLEELVLPLALECGQAEHFTAPERE